MYKVVSMVMWERYKPKRPELSHNTGKLFQLALVIDRQFYFIVDERPDGRRSGYSIVEAQENRYVYKTGKAFNDQSRLYRISVPYGELGNVDKQY